MKFIENVGNASAVTNNAAFFEVVERSQQSDDHDCVIDTIKGEKAARNCAYSFQVQNAHLGCTYTIRQVDALGRSVIVLDENEIPY